MGIIRQGNFLNFDNLTKFLNDIDDQNLLLATIPCIILEGPSKYLNQNKLFYYKIYLV
jgi:hypothetical protein